MLLCEMCVQHEDTLSAERMERMDDVSSRAYWQVRMSF
jgi:hypothetical protein